MNGDATLTRSAPPPRHPPEPSAGPPVPQDRDEHDLYPVHEEDNVPEKPWHRQQVVYLEGALTAYFPDKWVTGNLCMYWEERNFHQYAAPDVLVVDAPPPDPLPGTYLRWTDPPPLIVVEIGSRSTLVRDEGPKLETYERDLQVPEYLYYHPTRPDLHLYRLVQGSYEAVAPDSRGWVRSETLDLWFGPDEMAWLRLYTPTGEMLRSHAEEAQARQEEARARQEAETRAHQAEQRLAELEAALRQLRAGPE